MDRKETKRKRNDGIETRSSRAKAKKDNTNPKRRKKDTPIFIQEENDNVAVTKPASIAKKKESEEHKLKKEALMVATLDGNLFLTEKMLENGEWDTKELAKIALDGFQVLLEQRLAIMKENTLEEMKSRLENLDCNTGNRVAITINNANMRGNGIIHTADEQAIENCKLLALEKIIGQMLKNKRFEEDKAALLQLRKSLERGNIPSIRKILLGRVFSKEDLSSITLDYFIEKKTTTIDKVTTFLIEHGENLQRESIESEMKRKSCFNWDSSKSEKLKRAQWNSWSTSHLLEMASARKDCTKLVEFLLCVKNVKATREALLAASKNDCLENVKTLMPHIERGWNTDPKNLSHACRNGNFFMLVELLKDGKFHANDDNDCALVAACASGNFAMVKHLVDRCGADINCTFSQNPYLPVPKDKDNRGSAALASACRAGNLTIVEFLLNKDLLQTEKKYGYPLMEAIRGRHFHIVKHMLPLVADDDQYKSKFVWEACDQGDPHIANMLLEQGYPLVIPDDECWVREVMCTPNSEIRNILETKKL